AVLLAHQRLIGASRLEIVEADERHVLRFRRIAKLRRGDRGRHGERKNAAAEREASLRHRLGPNARLRARMNSRLLAAFPRHRFRTLRHLAPVILAVLVAGAPLTAHTLEE